MENTEKHEIRDFILNKWEKMIQKSREIYKIKDSKNGENNKM